jgi:UDP-N-acetylglucosamine 4,6-dehydratase
MNHFCGKFNSLEQRTILITGGTGSLGQVLVRQILRGCKTANVIVYSRDEFKQFEMQKCYSQEPRLQFMLGDVRDYKRLRVACQGADVVIHAAALKQVPTAEFNPSECIKTNIYGAENVIAASSDAGVEKVISVSTDKAVNPINLYGASKLCSDKLFIAANNFGNGRAMFAVVRYGNVMSSRGSVIPFFVECRKSGTIPITDERMTRFWITLDQAAAFVLHGLSMMRGGEVFVSKIPSMRIVDLARAIAPEAKIAFTGIRPGEKLHETLVPADEAAHTLEFQDYYLIKPSIMKRKLNYDVALDGESATSVVAAFCYASNANSAWMTEEQLREALSAST